MNTSIEQGTRWLMIVMSLCVALLMALPVISLAENCVPVPPGDLTDSDRDGFPDIVEHGGLCYATYDINNNVVYHLFPGKVAWEQDPTLTRDQYLDPDSPDLFIFIQYDDYDELGNYNDQYSKLRPFSDVLYTLMANSIEIGGLAVTGHLLQTYPPGLQMDPDTDQNALKVIEDATPFSSNILGIAPQGPINKMGVDATIYTGVIEQAVVRTYTDNGIAPPSDSELAYLTFKLIENTVVHESGHLLDLAEIYTRKGLRLIHQPQIGVLMDAEPDVDIRKGKVTWTFPDQWDATSQQLFELYRADVNN